MELLPPNRSRRPRPPPDAPSVEDHRWGDRV